MQSVKEYFGVLGAGAQRVGRRIQGKQPGGKGDPIGVGLKYSKNLLVSLDQFINTLAGGDPDETISSRLGRNYQGSLLYKIVNKLFFWQHGRHCDEAIEPENHTDDAVIK